jgi:hypothetical protein
MLRVLTPNGETALLNEPRCAMDGSAVYLTAYSPDFSYEVSVSCSYPRISPKPYHVHWLIREGIPDNQIYDIYDKSTNERIGLIFPLRSIGTKEHNRSDDEFFEAVAGAVFWSILEDKNSLSLTPQVQDSFSISDFFNDDVCLVVVNKSRFPDFNIVRYLPRLFRYGYFSFNGFIKDHKHWSSEELPKGKIISIHPIDECYLMDGYISSLFLDLLPYEENDLAQFLLIYQVFEVVMHTIFTDRISAFKTEIASFSGTASDLREMIDSIGRLSKERDRIRASMQGSKANGEDTSTLEDLCKSLIAAASATPKHNHCADLIYDVRNTVFHNLRSIPVAERKNIVKINNELARIMPKLLIKLPTPALPIP